MSNHLFRILGNFLQHGNQMSALAIGCAGTIHLTYAYGTKQQETITISDKYMMVRQGYTEFMVIDSKGRHFNIINSLWYWKWDAIEDWSSMKLGETLHVTYYGMRAPWGGLFPNVVGVTRVEPVEPIEPVEPVKPVLPDEVDKVETKA